MNRRLLVWATAALPVLLVGRTALAAPEVARVMRAPDSDTVLIFGEGFREGETEVLMGLSEVVWWPDQDTALIEAITTSGSRLPEVAPLPAMPPEGTPAARILQMDSQVIVAAAPQGWALWVRVGNETSRPVRVGLPELWWAHPDVVAPGQDFRVFGRALYSNPYRPVSYTFLVPEGGGQPLPVPVGPARHRFYDLALRVPVDTAPGTYRLYLHNGAGGQCGWSEPVTLRVAPPEPAPERVFNAHDHGAKGDGLADDTDALLAALQAAADAGGGTVTLPPGTYVVRTSLMPAEGVTLQGAGQSLTTLTVSERYGFAGRSDRAGPDSGLIVLANRCGVSDLTIWARQPLYRVVWVRREPWTETGEDVFIRRCTFRGGYVAWQPGEWRSNEVPIGIDGGVRRLAITDCTFDGTPGGISGWGGVTQGEIRLAVAGVKKRTVMQVSPGGRRTLPLARLSSRLVCVKPS